MLFVDVVCILEFFGWNQLGLSQLVDAGDKERLSTEIEADALKGKKTSTWSDNPQLSIFIEAIVKVDSFELEISYPIWNILLKISIELIFADFSSFDNSAWLNFIYLNIPESHDGVSLALENVLVGTSEPPFRLELIHKHIYSLASVYNLFNFYCGVIDSHRPILPEKWCTHSLHAFLFSKLHNHQVPVISHSD